MLKRGGYSVGLDEKYFEIAKQRIAQPDMSRLMQLAYKGYAIHAG